jgi:hypothetical protein
LYLLLPNFNQADAHQLNPAKVNWDKEFAKCCAECDELDAREAEMLAKGDYSFMTPEQQLCFASGHYVNVAHQAGWDDITRQQEPLQQSRYAALPMFDTV